MDSAKIAVGVIAATAIGLGLWCLSSDDNPLHLTGGAGKLDYVGTHTIERLTEILEELELEFICIYTRVYNLMLKVKDNGTWEEGMIKSLQAQVNEDLKSRTEQLLKSNNYKDLGVDSADLEKWIAQFAQKKRIRDQADMMKSLDHQVFEKQKIDHINFAEELPKELNDRMYIAIYRKIWYSIRHDIYMRIQEEKEKCKSSGQPFGKNEFIAVQNECHNNFEKVRRQVWEVMMDDRLPDDSKKARVMMQKAYATFATIPMGSSGALVTETAERSRWADQVSVIANQHTKYLGEFENGQFYDGIEHDPRENSEPDEKITLKGGAEYQRGQTGTRLERKNTLAEEGRNVKTMPVKAQKLISSYAQNFKKRFRERKGAKKQENLAEEDGEQPAQKQDDEVMEMKPQEEGGCTVEEIIEEVKPVEEEVNPVKESVKSIEEYQLEEIKVPEVIEEVKVVEEVKPVVEELKPVEEVVQVVEEVQPVVEEVKPVEEVVQVVEEVQPVVEEVKPVEEVVPVVEEVKVVEEVQPEPIVEEVQPEPIVEVKEEVAEVVEQAKPVEEVKQVEEVVQVTEEKKPEVVDLLEKTADSDVGFDKDNK